MCETDRQKEIEKEKRKKIFVTVLWGLVLHLGILSPVVRGHSCSAQRWPGLQLAVLGGRGATCTRGQILNLICSRQALGPSPLAFGSRLVVVFRSYSWLSWCSRGLEPRVPACAPACCTLSLAPVLLAVLYWSDLGPLSLHWATPLTLMWGSFYSLCLKDTLVGIEF